MVEFFQHQKEVFDRAKDRLYYYLALDCGLGKSLLAIRLLEYHFKAGRITAAMIIAPKGVLGNWAMVEIPKCSTVEYSCYVWNAKGNSSGENGIQYFIVNPDAVLTTNFPAVFKGFLSKHPSFALVCDEATFAKNGSAARTKRTIQIARLAKYRYAMSGTPVVNSPIDIYSQCEILKPNCLGFENIYAFKARYTRTIDIKFGMRSFKKVVGYRNLPELTATLKEFSAIVKKEECLDLPDKQYRVIPVALTSEQIGYYDQLKQEALTYIQGEEVTAINMIGLINKLLQICSGQMKIGDTYLSIPNNRLDTLSDLVNECPGKTIVWASYVGNALDIEKTLGERCVLLPSGIALEKRQDILTRFKNTDVKVLVANPASAGHGITLTESSNVIYYSRSYNLEHYLQSQDRTHRIGQTQSVLYTNLLAPGTLEEKVLAILQEKKELADSLITNREFVRKILSGE